MIMCIIVVKKAGINMPDEETIRTCWINNSDGAGIMYTHNKKVHITKGFMTLKSFNAEIKKLNKLYNLNDLPLVMHFRITTHGGTSQENCHPFPVNYKMPVLKKLKSKCNLAIAHNGIILNAFGSDKNVSDTMDYTANQLAHLYDLDKEFYLKKAGQTLVHHAIDSKMVFLDSQGRMELIGDFKKDKGGLFFSNGSYKPYKYNNLNALSDYSNYLYSIPDDGKIIELAWLDDNDGYLLNKKGDMIEPINFLVDEHDIIYAYAYNIGFDNVIKTDYTLHSHDGNFNVFIFHKKRYDEIEYFTLIDNG